MMGWCRTCRRMSPIADQYETDAPDGTTYYAEPLECGHDRNDGGHTNQPRPVTPNPATTARLVELQQAAARRAAS